MRERNKKASVSAVPRAHRQKASAKAQSITGGIIALCLSFIPYVGLAISILAIIVLGATIKNKRFPYKKFLGSYSLLAVALIIGIVMTVAASSSHTNVTTDQASTDSNTGICDNNNAVVDVTDKCIIPSNNNSSVTHATSQQDSPTAAAPTPTHNPTNTPAPIIPTETLSQKNAVSKAKEYLNVEAFSRDGLVDQLEYDQFSTADAIYGADNSGADWNTQATKKAQEYLSIESFSHDGLISQLEYDKFTPDQATYGVNAVGL